MNRFKATLEITGINPFVFVPEQILANVLVKAGKEKGHIPICGTVNGKKYTQTLLKYKGEWRLYINMTMLKDSPKRIGEIIELTIKYDSVERILKAHPKLTQALKENKQAKDIFNNLSTSKQKEIIRYISFLKSEASILKNIEKTVGFLLGKNKFIGRDNP